MNPSFQTSVSGAPTKSWYLPFLIVLSGMGGLLAGIDFGIIAGALLYLDKTIPMTAAQQGFMVAIYTFGGIIASLFAGTLADLLGQLGTFGDSPRRLLDQLSDLFSRLAGSFGEFANLVGNDGEP